MFKSFRKVHVSARSLINIVIFLIFGECIGCTHLINPLTLGVLLYVVIKNGILLYYENFRI